MPVGDAFDISWAVDTNSNYVELDEIHFIKVHTGVMDGAGWLGQISTEITGAAVVEPDPTLTGNHELVVIQGDSAHPLNHFVPTGSICLQ